MKRERKWTVGLFALVTLPVTLMVPAIVAPTAIAQTLLTSPGGQVHVVGSELAVLTTQDPRKEINCSVTPVKPMLGFDFRFHAGFVVAVPLKELSGSENNLTILFRVTPLAHAGDISSSTEPSYFVQHYRVPEIRDDAGGEAQLNGSMELGQGNYHVDWLMRDRDQRVCSHYWDMDAELPSKDRDMKLDLEANTVGAMRLEQFTPEPAAARNIDKTPLKIKVLVNFAPQDALAATMRPQDTSALVSILRNLAREPQFGKFSVVAFNIQEQRILYRQDEVEQIDFPALGDALQGIKLGTVDAQKLHNKHGDVEFLTELIQTEMTGTDRPDALIFAGPKVMLDGSVPEETLKPLASVDYPVFYMNYSLNPQATPWRDSIGRAVKAFKGTEYTISRPRDLWYSMTEMIGRIVRSSYGRTAFRPAQ